MLSTGWSENWPPLLGQQVPFDARQLKDNILGALGRLGCPMHLIKVLQDIHVDAWCSLNNSDLIRTRRGTRPGSPLADAVFHLVMAEIVHDIDRWIFKQTDYVQLLQEIGLSPLTITWADDLAIPWATTLAADLPAALDGLMGFVTHAFEKRGFSVNFSELLSHFVAKQRHN